MAGRRTEQQQLDLFRQLLLILSDSLVDFAGA